MTLLDTDPAWIDLEGAVNARDVGGLPLSDGGTVPAGRLLRSDNLQDLTPSDVERLVTDHGLRRVVDLRTGVEVAREGDGPLIGDARVTVEHRSLYPEVGDMTDLEVDAIVPWQRGVTGSPLPGETPTVQTYMGYLEHRPDSVVAALETVADPGAEGGAVLVHCAAGKDRTGLVVAFALEVAGVSRDAVVADYVATGQRIDGIVARLAASPTYARDMHVHDPSAHAPRAASMQRILALLDERHGGAGGWLRDHGMDAGALQALRARLT
ncbi:MAG: protein-tyrosine-phosphatase [Conexibacter sp.]|jgi:protein tyrosine/serine phosphatase|nr:protein-tyrosine-phosphatase [Conexibacter sp.]